MDWFINGLTSCLGSEPFCDKEVCDLYFVQLYVVPEVLGLKTI